ncbi:MAG TPA: ASKHA domain-containing protein [Rectinemataceae bacterium]|nr:ASKHA domain-containing protein [Rectinemataceae bacterium]
MDMTVVKLLLESGELVREIEARSDKSLLEALHSPSGRASREDSGEAFPEGPDSPCGGRGLCGKCRARVSGSVEAPTAEEGRLLSRREFEAGYRLLCLARPSPSIDERGPARVELEPRGRAAIITEGPRLEFAKDPPSIRIRLRLEAPNLEDQASDEERLLRALAVAGHSPIAALDLAALRQLAFAARAEELSVVLCGNEVLAIGPGEDADRASYSLGVDIGTTTLACYLVDLCMGGIVATGSALNEQRSFGADVISRMAAAMGSPGGLEALRSRIVAQIAEVGRQLLVKVGAEVRDLLSVAIAGNTTMMHLFAGVQPAAIAAAPFSPVFSSARRARAGEIGLGFDPACELWMLPSVSGYVGADIVSGIAAIGMADRGGCELLLDIGTNGEIALGGSGGIWCCATAAGPAFEGAGVGMGMGGVAGAIDAVWLDGEDIGFSTIGGGSPRGLCGSGVLDALAVFLEAGLVDETGRIPDEEELASLPKSLAARRLVEEGQVRLEIGGGVWLSQTDVRNLQLAVSAIAAGIDVLLARSGRGPEEIDRVWLAGGFGSYLDLGSALRVGLVPAAMGDRVIVAGNASGAGAAAASASRSFMEATGRIRGLCRYVELSSSHDFTEAYMEHLIFPEA